MEYYNAVRTHLSLGKDAPIRRVIQCVGPIGVKDEGCVIIWMVVRAQAWAAVILACPCRKLNPHVLMVQSPKHGSTFDADTISRQCVTPPLNRVYWA
jgi:hypothetical protein